MPRRRPDLDRAIAALAATQHQVVTAGQLRALGLHGSTARNRIAAGGPWRRLLPGTYLVHRGRPSDDERLAAAFLYAGAGAVITGTYALPTSRVAARQRDGQVHVLVPHHRHRASSGFVTIERTTRLPAERAQGFLNLAEPARAALDAARRSGRLDDVRALLADVVQNGLTTPERLRSELETGPVRGSRLARAALDDILAGARSSPEAELRQLWLRSGAAEPLWNVTLVDDRGRFIARPDAYVPEAGVVVEVDSQEFHYSAASWEATNARHARLTALGLSVLHVTPRRVRTAGDEVMGEIIATVERRRGHAPSGVHVRPTR